MLTKLDTKSNNNTIRLKCVCFEQSFLATYKVLYVYLHNDTWSLIAGTRIFMLWIIKNCIAIYDVKSSDELRESYKYTS